MQGTNPVALFQTQSIIPLYMSHLFLQNVPTPDIARKTGHTEGACDRYIIAFKKVKMLYGRMTPLEISQTLTMSERLVNEYVALIEERKSLTEEVNDFS